VQVVLYGDWPIALAEPERVVLHPALLALAELDEFHPLVRFVCALCLHAFEVDTGLAELPFDQGRAERFARELLMPADEFLDAVDERDAALAERFGVPIEQVPARRLDLGLVGRGSLP
jgi:hypothetical protein